MHEGPARWSCCSGPCRCWSSPTSAHIEPERAAELEAWIETGGVLLRFAGPKLAQPTERRAGACPAARRRPGARRGVVLVRAAGAGALSAGQPVRRAAGPQEAEVSRQVLAEPGPDLPRHLGAPRRRHAAGHRREPRQGLARSWSTPPPTPPGRTCRSPACSCRCWSASGAGPRRRRPQRDAAGARPRARCASAV